MCSGLFCEIELNFCDTNTCENGAKCVKNPNDNSGFCDCPQGFYGEFCEANGCPSIEIPDDPSNPCKNNAECVIASNNALKCLCKTGFGGKFCQFKI